MKKQTNDRFYATLEDINIIVITGVCRTGKTTLARFIGSMENVIYFDEPWLQMMLPVMQGIGIIRRDIAKNIMVASTVERLNDAVLLRNANFRPTDLSNIWERKEEEEIYERLVKLKTRTDVKKYISKKHPSLLYVLSEANPFIDFIYECFPQSKIINVTRDKTEIAEDIEKKHWLSDNSLSEPQNAILYREFEHKGKKYIPWWVEPGHEEDFIKMPEFKRALYYSERLPNINKEYRDSLKNDVYAEVSFSEIFNSTAGLLKKMEAFLNLESTKKTEKMLESFRAKDAPDKKNLEKSAINLFSKVKNEK